MKAARVSTAVAALLFSLCSAAAERLPPPDRGGVPQSPLYDHGGMGPPATPAIVAAAEAAVGVPLPRGPFAPTWESIEANYRTPEWFRQTRFGIFIHWGLYSAAAHHNEWYEKHMYAGEREWHEQHFGPQEQFGYKDFIKLFTLSKWNPDEWARLFHEAGAQFVVPTAQHHDNFALWNSKVTPFNSVAMGPHRDIIGELGAAVRKEGMRFGVSNHGIENFTFINPDPALDARLKAANADLYDPRWREFYNVADRSDAAMQRFLTDWTRRNLELIDRYRPDLLWFDNGANLRVLDPLKRRIAAHYYNRALQWGKQVTLSSKYVAYAPSNDDRRQIGSVIDFEKVGKRSPAEVRTGPWIVDDPIGSTWGYTTDMTVSPAEQLLFKLVDTASKGGTYLLNISPMADGTIPDAQRAVLRDIGSWLKVNGRAVFGARPWRNFSEAGRSDLRFLADGDTVFAIVSAWPGKTLRIESLSAGTTGIGEVRLQGQSSTLAFAQNDAALEISTGDAPPQGVRAPYAFAIRLANRGSR